MNTRHRIYLIFLILNISIYVNATDLFSDDFESPVTDTAKPKWNWQTPYPASKTGMMLGEEDMYSRTLAYKHSGKYSLRLNFEGRNGFCNTCRKGTETCFVGPGVTNSKQYIDNGGCDLDSIFNVTPDPQARLYNSDDNWSRWQVDSITGNTITFKGNDSIQNDMGGAGLFNSGDEIKIVKTCAVNEDRKDCDLAINYLRGLVPADDFDFGNTLARRMYIYIPAVTIIPNIGFKLAYTHFKRNGIRYPQFIIFKGSSNKVSIQNRSLYGTYEFGVTTLDRDMWYYIEEVYIRESGPSLSDGEYRLYIARADQPANTPLIHKTSIKYGELIDMSIGGNFQNNIDAKGSIYFDDVAVGTSRIGKVSNPAGVFPLEPQITNLN